ncbi:MAG: AAA domain-containing protein [Acidimicrobiaceae bacterium]|nr:AAA domain-containing protein [Acidimicrobiaceae bacterium]
MPWPIPQAGSVSGVTTEFDRLVEGLAAGARWPLLDKTNEVKELLESVLQERAHKSDVNTYQIRANLQRKQNAASFAGYITAQENPTSGPYQGTSFVWFPGEAGSVAVLVIGTDGFGADKALLSRSGHARRLRALARAHAPVLWVKPDLLDLAVGVPESVTRSWPAIDSQLRMYSRFIYAAAPIRDVESDGMLVGDLLDLFLHEHGTRHKGPLKAAWEDRLAVIEDHIFPSVDVRDVEDLLLERRFVILEGPPGTGKTMMAREVGQRIGSSEMVQFHPARTYEDFVVGLYPRETNSQTLSFHVRKGDLLRANETAAAGPHVLIVDEINRADLGRVLGEAISLFESGESNREVVLPHVPADNSGYLQLSPNLLVLGTRNTADRSIARIDLAIRRRFAFLEMWPLLSVVRQQADEMATAAFEDVLRTFSEHADDDGLRLTPGHAYFLDPRPDLNENNRRRRILRRLRLELVPLLRDYARERLLGPATSEVMGLADRIESLTYEQS